MKISFILIMAVFILGGCNFKPFEVVEEAWPSGKPKIIKYYRNESKEILLKESRFYEDGTKKIEGNFEDGERSGQWSYWYEDGKLWSQAVYKKGKENGLRTVFHKNGQKYYEGMTIDDKRSGNWKFWNENGELIKEIDYDKK
jgi:antitoxin component YwqK of YwqJK toxin-antitoxin module